MTTNRERLIDAAEQSPRAVKTHDKSAWLNIFSKDYHLEDPVGSKLKVSPIDEVEPREPLSRFYDTFIAPNDIVFDVTRDIVCGNHVMRDLTLNVKLAGKLSAYTPMHLLYEMVEEGDCYKVARLEAHWEYAATNRQAISHGFAAVPILTAMVGRMIKHLGWRGMLAFSESSKTVGEAGKSQVNTFIDALANRDQVALLNAFEEDKAVVHFPYGEPPLTVSEFLASFDGSMNVNKLLAAGDRVTATLAVQNKGQSRDGVALFEFEPKTLKIRKLVFYVE